MNLDRNDANILVRFSGSRGAGEIGLVPIDHGCAARARYGFVFPVCGQDSTYANPRAARD